MAGRLVVEHKDGRRVSVLESRFDDPAANPFERERVVISTDGRNEVRNGRTGKPRSLKQDGFRIVGRILRDGREVGLKEAGEA